MSDSSRTAGAYKFSNTIENVKTRVDTRGVRVYIPGTQIPIQVSSNKVDSNPWEPATVQIPQSKITYDQWRDLTRAVELGFAEYEKRFQSEDEKLVLIEEKNG